MVQAVAYVEAPRSSSLDTSKIIEVPWSRCSLSTEGDILSRLDAVSSGCVKMTEMLRSKSVKPVSWGLVASVFGIFIIVSVPARSISFLSRVLDRRISNGNYKNPSISKLRIVCCIHRGCRVTSSTSIYSDQGQNWLA